MLRVYFLQQWFNLCDPGAEDALYESPVLRHFVGIDLGRAPVPDESTILGFRHLLEKHELGGAMLNAVNQYLESRGIRISTGTIVDATIIHAPSSTKNRSRARSGNASDQEGKAVVCVTNASASLRCCTEDGSRPPEVGLQEQTSNRPVLLRSKGVVVSDWGKGIDKVSGTY